MSLEMNNPWMLVLLVALAAVWWVTRRTLTDFSRGQLRVMLVVRSLIVILLVLALAGVVFTRTSSRTAVLVLADVSPSVADDAVTLSSHLADAVRDASGEPVVAASFDNTPHAGRIARPSASARATDLAAALRFARATLPAEYVGRVVLLTDGRATTGDTLEEARHLERRGIELVVAELPESKSPEVIARRLEVSGTPTPGATVELVAHVASRAETSAEVAFYVDGFRIGDARKVDLARGETRVTSAVRLAEGGPHEYSFSVTAADDTYRGNNRAAAVVVLPAELKVLIVEGREDDAKYLVRALESAGLKTDVRAATGFPTEMVDLDRYASVVLADVPATSLSSAQMTLAKRWVEDLGGGLVMTGGEDSFGPGGYFRTPIEEVLPVRLDVEKKKEEPTVAMMILLDKSGSMDGKKIRLAKEAALAAVDLLGAEDQVGVVTFDAQAYVVSPLVPVSERLRISGTLSTVNAGGGTNMLPALEESYRMLTSAKARVKHVIALTDGKTAEGDFAGIVRRMSNDGITVSCVAVGAEADVALLQNIARWGRGRFYFTRDALSIPQIFARETVTAARSSVVEEPFRARVVRDVELIRGIDFRESPYLMGYVSTKAKPTAEVILATERAEPLLARWRVGLGKTVAFTSDVRNRWAAEWVSWGGFGKFWAQVIRSVSRTAPAGTFDLAMRFEGDDAVVTLDAADASGRFRNRASAEASLIAPDGTTHRATLVQTAPGRYRGRAVAKASGTYVASARLAGASGEVADVVVTGAVKPADAEYTSLDVDAAALRRLADAAGGTLVAPGEWAAGEDAVRAFAARLVKPSERRVKVRTSLRPVFLWSALALFLLDLVLRRVDFTSLAHRRATSAALVLLCVFAASTVAAAGAMDARAEYLDARRSTTLERLAVSLAGEGKLDEARKLLEAERARIVAVSPEGSIQPADARVLYLLGVIEEMSGQPAKRDAIFADVRRRTAADEFGHYALAVAFERLHREDVAAWEYERVLALEPRGTAADANALRSLASMDYTNRRYASAAARYETVLKLLTGRTDLAASEALLRHLRYVEAVCRGYATLEANAGDWPRALEACERAWTLDPDRIDAPVLGERIARTCPDRARGEALAKTWRERSAHVEKVLRADINAWPHAANRYNALAWFFAELDRNHDEAVALAKRACELDPAEDAYVDTLAECYFRKGDVDAAVRTIRRVTDAYPFANDYYRAQLERFEAARKKTGE